MGHDVKTYIGVDIEEPMGSRSLAEMGAMEMPAPDNTLPMMTELRTMKPDDGSPHSGSLDGPMSTAAPVILHRKEILRQPRQRRSTRTPLAYPSPKSVRSSVSKIRGSPFRNL